MTRLLPPCEITHTHIHRYPAHQPSSDYWSTWTAEIRLNISLDYGSLVFEVCSKESKSLRTFLLSLTPLRQIINDYHTICQSYFSAVKKLPIDKIEAIDMGRKGIHNEGARVLIQRLEGKINLNLETSRRIFTLIYALTYER